MSPRSKILLSLALGLLLAAGVGEQAHYKISQSL